MEFSSEENMVIRRALSGYAQWCRDRACACAQKTSKAPPEAVGQAFTEEDRAKALHIRFVSDTKATAEALMEADEIMQGVHRAIRDNHPQGTIYAQGAADALFKAGLLTPNSHRLWNLAIQACPGHNDEGGRVWCAYCGNLPSTSGTKASGGSDA